MNDSSQRLSSFFVCFFLLQFLGLKQGVPDRILELLQVHKRRKRNGEVWHQNVSDTCAFWGVIVKYIRARMYEDQIKLKPDSPIYQFAEESVSPALLPHARFARRLQNSCFFVFIFRSGKLCLFSIMQRK